MSTSTVLLGLYLRGSSSHVDNARSGEVNGTNTQESIFSEGSQKSISRPDGADDNWVDLRLFSEKNKFIVSDFRVSNKLHKMIIGHLQMQ